MTISQKLETIEQNEGDIRIQHNKVFLNDCCPVLIMKLKWNYRRKGEVPDGHGGRSGLTAGSIAAEPSLRRTQQRAMSTFTSICLYKDNNHTKITFKLKTQKRTYGFVEQLHLTFHLRQKTLDAEFVHHVLNAVNVVGGQASAVRNDRLRSR